ncbi:MAG: AEC family transporter, partial [Thermodesulfovibrionales bacterium]
AAILPVVVAVCVFFALYVIIGFRRNTLFLLIQSTVFGSLAFFGIPFISFAFPSREAESLAILSVASISPVSVAISVVVLEFYRLPDFTLWEGVVHVCRRLSRNPLILSIFVGTLLSVTGIGIPVPVSSSLHMLGSTTSTVAIFMLGVFFFGRTYGSFPVAIGLSLLRMVLLPAIALLTAWAFGVTGPERAVMVLMHSMPIAISMIILSERYEFFQDIIASLVLFSSLAAILYLNIWLFLLGA